MAVRKTKSRVTENDDNYAENLSKTSSENFTSFFLKLCEEYDVNPLPRIFVNSAVALSTIPSNQQIHGKGPSLRKTDEIEVPLINLTKESNNIEKIECKGHEISVCILDALGMTLENFRTVTTIKLPNCRINAFGISQIGEILRDVGCVRDLNLDMNPNIRENYYLLCTPMGKLSYLSLKYCNISDLGLERIAIELKNSDHEVSQLISLDLSNNRITDLGAEKIANMLHTNRSLQSLILAGNRINDFGASLIIQELCMYTLSHEEIVELRRENYKKLLQREEDSLKILQPRISANSSKNSSRKNSKTSKTRKSNNNTTISAKNNEVYSTILHPLNVEIRMIKGQIMAAGNFELQHLNLSYNQLTDKCLENIAKCIFYQSYTMLQDTSKGLLYLNLEGNNFCNEEASKQICDLLRKRTTPQNEDILEIIN